ncbi:hypothetical protein [Haliscomenobacter sp.]|uniref:hypothetical protein n=1 Tax=Haliscomenobacter sp. TaxID=2717303 RepID=UPI003593F6EA
MRTKYLRFLPFMVLAVIPLLLWDSYFQNILSKSGSILELSTIQGLILRLAKAFPDWLAFLFVGFVFNKRKEALIAISVNLFFVLFFTLINIRLPFFLLHLPITLAPFFVFGFLAFGPKRLWIWILMIVPIFLDSPLEMANKLFSQDFNFFISLFYNELGGENYLEPLGDEFKLSGLIAPMVYYVFLAEISLLFAQKSRFNPSVVDLTMPYSRLGAAFLFIFLRLSIYSCILGVNSTITEIFNPTRFANDALGKLNLQLVYFLYLISAMTALIAALWYYRRFLMEFLFERGERPSWGYWLLQIPFVEVVIFTFMVIFLKKRDDEDKYQVFLYHNEESANDVKIIRGLMVVFQILAIVYLVTNPAKKELTNFILLDKLTYSILVIFYLVRPKVLWGLLGWICLNIVFAALGFIHDLEFDSRLLSFSTLFLLIGLFHGSDFSCISPYNENNETETDVLIKT